MPQTKRKRRTKHRGNAAGSIEVRGRTGRKPRPEETRAKAAAKSSTRAVRGTSPPSWKSAFAKACFGAVMLFAAVKIGLLGDAERSTVSALQKRRRGAVSRWLSISKAQRTSSPLETPVGGEVVVAMRRN